MRACNHCGKIITTFAEVTVNPSHPDSDIVEADVCPECEEKLYDFLNLKFDSVEIDEKEYHVVTPESTGLPGETVEGL